MKHHRPRRRPSSIRSGWVALLLATVILTVPVAASAGTLDGIWPAGGYADDVVRGGIWSRSALQSYLYIYRPYGMNENFVNYCDVIDVWAGTSTPWGGTMYMNSTSFPYINHWFTNINSVIINASSHTFSAWCYGSTFVSRVCGNQTTSIQNPPFPHVSGAVFNDLNGSSVRDTGEPTLAGQPTKLMLGASQVRTQATNGSGGFDYGIDAAAGLPPGTYTPQMSSIASGWVQTKAAAAQVIAQGPASAGRYFNTNTDIGLRQIIPPVTTLTTLPTSPTGNNGWYRTPLTYGFSVNESATTSYWVDGGIRNTYTTGARVVVPEGIHTVAFRSIDVLGDVETTKTTSFKVDVTKPTAVTAAWQPTGPSSVIISWTSSTDAVSGVAGYEVRDSGTGAVLASTGTGTTQAPLTGLDPRASYGIVVVAIDVAGNESDPSGVVSFVIDDRAPVTTIDADPASPTGDNGWYRTPLTYGFTVDETATTSYRVDAGTIDGYTAGARVPVEEGTHTIRYRSIDPAGNVEDTKTATFKVDVTKPTAVTADWRIETTTSVRLTWTPSTDAVSGVVRHEVRDAGSGAVLATTDAATTEAVLGGVDPDTTYQVVIVAVDAAGNESDPSGVVQFLLHWTDGSGENRIIPPGEVIDIVTDTSITITFDKVTTPGTVTVKPGDDSSAPSTGEFWLVRGAHWVIETSADFEGWVYITFPFDPDELKGQEKNLKLKHWKNNGWEDITWSIDYENNTITGRTSSFSPFAVVEQATGQSVTRLGGGDRYAVARAVASTAWPGYKGVRHVIVAAGPDRSAADPLAAAGLAGVYDAPVLLVRPDVRALPVPTLSALKGIAAANEGTICVHIVGGSVSVPTWVNGLIRRVSPRFTIDRISGADRYECAAAIAKRMRTELASRGETVPGVFVANGAEQARFFDALALGPIAYGRHMPILLVKRDIAPPATRSTLQTLAPDPSGRFICGPTAAVSNVVRDRLGVPAVNRIADRTDGSRYATARAVGAASTAKGWLPMRSAGVGNRLPDCLTGGTGMGKMQGPILFTASTALPTKTSSHLHANRAYLGEALVFGGRLSVSDGVMRQVGDALR